VQAVVLFVATFLVALGVIEYAIAAVRTIQARRLRRARTLRVLGLRSRPIEPALRVLRPEHGAGLADRATAARAAGVDELTIEDFALWAERQQVRG
jgi:hypothetical protein